MVSSLSIIFMVVTILVSFGLPIGLTVYMYKKYKIRIKAVLVGALMFFVFQGLLRLPLLSYVQKLDSYRNFAAKNLIITVIIIAFTAALFETAGRYIGMKWILKDSLEWKNGIAYGIGHGGIEAILIVGIAFIANLVLSLTINSGAVSSLAYSQLVNTSPDLFFAAGVERFFTIFLHIALSLLVLYGIMYRKKSYILLCILVHTLVDGLAGILSIKGVSPWGLEAIVAVFGILSLIFVLKSKNMFITAVKSSESL